MKETQNQTELGTAIPARTLFKPSSWMTKIDFISHLVLFNNVFMTVLSEKKGGKTSFCSLLLNQLDQQIKSVFIAAKVPCEREAVLGAIATQLHLNVDSNTSVASLVAQINERKAHVLLVIDDAQHLPEELIKEFIISIKSQEDSGFFHLCTVSDYSVVATLNKLVSGQFENLIHTIELSALTNSETRTYVLQRAMMERLINKPLSDSQLEKLYRQTQGSIAKINADLESFIFNSAPEKEKSTATLVKKASLSLAMAAVAGFSFVYLSDLGKTTEQAPIAVTSLPSIKEAINEQVKEVVEVLSYIPSLHDNSVIQLVQNTLPKKQILDIAEEDQLPNTVALVDKVIVIPSVTKNTAERESRLADNTAIHEAQLKQPTQFDQAKASVLVPAKQALVAQMVNTTGYTIQLAASHQQKDLSRFKQSNDLYAETKIRHFSNQKEGWYVLTLGEFSTRAQAQEQIKKLHSTIGKLKPWVRPVSGLKDVG